MRILKIIMLLVSFSVMTQSAKAAESAWLETDFVKMRLISASETAGMTGTLSLGLEVVLADGWKTYWRTPGDAGLAPQIFLNPILMNGAKADLHFPLPKRFTLFGLDTFGYGTRVVFPIDLALADLSQAQMIEMTAEALVCSDICVPVSGALSLSLPAGAARGSIYGQELAKIRSNLPKIAPASAALYLASQAQDPQGAGHLIAVLDEGLVVDDILVEGLAGVSYGVPQDLGGGRYLIQQIGGAKTPESAAALTLTVDAGAQSIEAPVILQASQALPISAAQAALPYWLIALIGGFILNFMPCVLPVLSLKIASILSMGGTVNVRGYGRARSRFLASAAGIIASFGLLALFLHLLRAAGGQVGWGIQFQSPVFLGALVLITGLFTLSLFDLVHLRAPAFVSALLPKRQEGGTSLWGDFGAGMLATILATPCSAPFVGTAVSFALSQSDGVLYGMLGMMGLGLALPWLALALFPQMIALLPKPGPWMVTLQRGLGVLMALTVLWVASLFYNAVQGVQEGPKSVSDERWRPFDSQLLAELIADERLVFVDVTADWCISCKANKALVLDTASVSVLFAENDVIMMQADWTLPDDEIAAFLASYERFGIPFNVLYGKAAPQGVILPEILTYAAIEKAVVKANQ